MSRMSMCRRRMMWQLIILVPAIAWRHMAMKLGRTKGLKWDEAMWANEGIIMI